MAVYTYDYSMWGVWTGAVHFKTDGCIVSSGPAWPTLPENENNCFFGFVLFLKLLFGLLINSVYRLSLHTSCPLNSGKHTTPIDP